VSWKINGIQNVNQVAKNRDVFIAQTDIYLAQLNWSPEQVREFLVQKYGKKSRQQLCDSELVEFTSFLRSQLS